MKLGTLNKHISICKGGVVKYNFGDGVKIAPEGYITNRLIGLTKYFKGNYTEAEKIDVYNQVCEAIGEPDKKVPVDEYGSPVIMDQTELAKASIQKMMNFFTEFEFEPNFRFLNTFCMMSNKSKTEAKNFVRNYFELTDNSSTNAIYDKMRSVEFTEIIDNFAKIIPTHQVNNRFKLYYGSAGTGKTTQAMKEAEGCMVCHSAMLPSDLMEDFKFVDGNATFQPSTLQNAITTGQVIVLDEINLLPFESLRFLQSILDGKKEFEYKGKTIQIADGFKIIGTMNLAVNGCIYALPEPLVDRCEYIRKYKLTADDLVGALI